MRFIRFLATLALVATTGIAMAQGTPSTPAAQNAQARAPQVAIDKNKLSYAVGYQIGANLSGDKIDVDMATVVRGLQDAYAKRQPTVPVADMQQQLGAMQQKLYTEAKAAFDKLAAENKQSSAKFLAENRTKKGIVTLPSGLQYQVIEEGQGAKHPTADSQVTVHYRGSLPNGLEFESTFARGEPVTFKVNQTVKGWQEVLPLMKVGDYWRVFLPAELAYGERGQPPRIGPNQALVFEIKLLDVKP